MSDSIRWRFEKAVRDDATLSSKAKLVAVMLRSRMDASGRCDPGVGRIMRDTALGGTTIRTAIAELADRGYLDVTVGGGRATGGNGRTNLYRRSLTPRLPRGWRRENPSPREPLARRTPRETRTKT